jgi:SAM-dependent methyltransferase
MNIKFLNILCCPLSGSELKLVPFKISGEIVEEGELINKEGKKYPILRGIPRFVENQFYSESFGYEWLKWPRLQFESENKGKIMEGYTFEQYQKMTSFTKEDLEGKLVIDYGCGPGRFIELARNSGAIVVGIDLSIAVEAARNNFKNDDNVLIVQGDVLNPPFQPNTFDVGYTIGVLHHTPNPEAGFLKLSTLIKSKGRLACAVYGNKLIYARPLVHRLRRFFNRISTITGNKPALFYSYFSSYILFYLFQLLERIPYIWKLANYARHNWFVIIQYPDARWRLLDTFDAITPKYASTHSETEVINWFKKAFCYNIKQTQGTVSFIANKN